MVFNSWNVFWFYLIFLYKKKNNKITKKLKKKQNKTLNKYYYFDGACVVCMGGRILPALIHTNNKNNRIPQSNGTQNENPPNPKNNWTIAPVSIDLFFVFAGKYETKNIFTDALYLETNNKEMLLCF